MFYLFAASSACSIACLITTLVGSASWNTSPLAPTTVVAGFAGMLFFAPLALAALFASFLNLPTPIRYLIPSIMLIALLLTWYPHMGSYAIESLRSNWAAVLPLALDFECLRYATPGA